MKTLGKLFSCFILLLALNLRAVCRFFYEYGYSASPFPAECRILEMICYFLVVYINFFPALTVSRTSTLRHKILEDGASILQIFLTTTVLESLLCIVMLFLTASKAPGDLLGFLSAWLRYLLPVFLVEFVLFWNGILRVYLTSVQLGIRWRVIGILCGFIPIVHLYVLCRIIGIARTEVQLENEKYLLNLIRA